MTARSAIPWILFAGALGPASAAMRAQPPRAVDEPGVSGYVLAPDGTPVTGGTVLIQPASVPTAAPIDGSGRFRIAPTRPGLLQLLVNVPGMAPYRLALTVPASRSLRLPVIRLAPGAYFRVRLVSSGGEPIMTPRLRRQSFEANGKLIFDVPGDPIANPTDADGAVTLGPLPRGVMTVAVDMPSFAQTRLPDLNFGDTGKTVDGGTIVIEQPGAVLHVDVVDATGTPVPNHEVILEDVRPRSPLVFPRVRTNQQGRGTFDRLATGRYRVLTPAVDWCANVTLMATQVVAVSGSGTIDTRIVAGGSATFRITSTLGPAGSVPISAAPNVPASPGPLPFRFRTNPVGCPGVTDADGRVTLTNFPPGPSHVDVRMSNSIYVRQINVPSDGRELAIVIPDGLLSVRVVNALTNQPVFGARMTWTGSGGRVEAMTSASGDALLEGVGTAGGTLAVAAAGYRDAEEQLAELPGIPHDVALTPNPPPANVRARVITTSGEPLPNAVVELVSADPAAIPRVAVTDASGAATFPDAASGSLEMIASADGFATSNVGVDPASEAVLALPRGYRVIASVELPATAGSQMVRVMNDSGASMDALLDSASDRRLEPPGRLSIGPLAAGTYVIELRGAGGRRQERVRIVEGDVSATFR